MKVYKYAPQNNYIPGFNNLNYEERLNKLKLPTLNYRRHRGDMIEIYKISSGKYDPEAADFIKWRKDHSVRETSRGNTHKIFVQRPNFSSRKHCFTMRAAKIWNSLPDHVASAKTINTFKNRLDNHWKNQDMLYNYKAAINCNTGSHTIRDLEEFNEDSESGEEA